MRQSGCGVPGCHGACGHYPPEGTAFQVMVTVHRVEESSLRNGPVSLRPSACGSPLTAQQPWVPFPPNTVSHAGVSVSPVVFIPLTPAPKFCTTYWLNPGIVPFDALQATTGLAPGLQSSQGLPPSDGVAFVPGTKISAAMPVLVIVTGKPAPGVPA